MGKASRRKWERRSKWPLEKQRNLHGVAFMEAMLRPRIWKHVEEPIQFDGTDNYLSADQLEVKLTKR